MANVVDSKLPQTVSYVVSPDAAPLSSLYVPQDGSAPTSYLIRNYALRYAIYPVLLVTFLVDRFSLVKYLGWLHWKSLGGGVLGVGLVATLVSSPYLEGYGQFPLVLLYLSMFMRLWRGFCWWCCRIGFLMGSCQSMGRCG